MAGSKLAARLQARVVALEGAVRDLCTAESAYRACHDIYGDGDPHTGRAWDTMRRRAEAARKLVGEEE